MAVLPGTRQSPGRHGCAAKHAWVRERSTLERLGRAVPGTRESSPGSEPMLQRQEGSWLPGLD